MKAGLTLVLALTALLGCAQANETAPASTAEAGARGPVTGTSSASASAKSECSAPPSGADDDQFDENAMETLIDEAGSRGEASRWLRVQAAALRLEKFVLSGTYADEYRSLSFHVREKRVVVYTASHQHDRSILNCARDLGIRQYIRIETRTLSQEDLADAMQLILDDVPDLLELALVETSAGSEDRIYIAIDPAASNQQVARVRNAARSAGVPFSIRRERTR